MSFQAPEENLTVLAEFDAGIFGQKLAKAMADVALNVVTQNKAGKVTVTLDFTSIAEGRQHQVNIKHKLAFVQPTGNGKVTEENTTATAVYVGPGGKLTLMPESQTDLFKRRAEAAADDADTD